MSQSQPCGDRLCRRYDAVRAFSHLICQPLETEDYVIQSMPDVSPAKWHLAHTSWFFETFLLKPHLADYESPFPQYNYLFNSYYNAVGERHCRPRRGFIGRPTVAQTYEFRQFIDEQMHTLICGADAAKLAEIEPLVVLGLHHEQQHQELMVTDLKHVFAQNPLYPTYREREIESVEPKPAQWKNFDGGLQEIGFAGEGFSFDNEHPRHKVWLEPFALSTQLVSNADWLEFIEAGGYQKPEFWLSTGWATVQDENWQAPFYWEQRDGKWLYMTLSGLREVEPSEPVCHVSYFEADAFARWKSLEEKGVRLPTEFEWEFAAHDAPIEGHFADNGAFHPIAAKGDWEPFGNLWQWTRSQYVPYPGYEADRGALGEYNGKFMCNQFVLRGGSCATSQSHIRATYRNFFPPDARWQFSGLRLAKSL